MNFLRLFLKCFRVMAVLMPALVLISCGGGGGGSSSPTAPESRGSIIVQGLLDGTHRDPSRRVVIREITVLLDGERIGHWIGNDPAIALPQASKTGVAPGRHTLDFRIERLKDSRGGRVQTVLTVFWTPSPGDPRETFTVSQSTTVQEGSVIRFNLDL